MRGEEIGKENTLKERGTLKRIISGALVPIVVYSGEYLWLLFKFLLKISFNKYD